MRQADSIRAGAVLGKTKTQYSSVDVAHITG